MHVASPRILEPVEVDNDASSDLYEGFLPPRRVSLLNSWLSLAAIATAMTVVASLLRPASSLGLGITMIPYVSSVLANARVVLLLSKHVRTPDLGALNPYSIVVCIVCTIYVARPLFILRSGILGSAGTSEQSLAGMETAMANALASTSLAISVLSTGLVAGVLSASSSSNGRNVTTRARPRGDKSIGILGLIATFLLVLVLRTIFDSERGFFGALTARQLTFEAKMHLLWAAEYLRLAVIALIGARRSAGSKVGTPIKALYGATICLDFLSGSRTELLLNNLLLCAAVLLVTSVRSNRLQQRDMIRFAGVLAALCFFVGFVALRQYVRDERGQFDASAVVTSVIRMDEYILDSDEAAGFDYLVQIQGEFPRSHQYRGLSGVASIAAAPIPSAIFPGKPDRASVALTAVLAPDRVKQNANIAVSGFADLYSIGGLASLLLGSAIVGTLLGFCMRFARNFSAPYVRVIVAYAVALSMMDAIRSDIFSAALTPARLVLVWVALKTVLLISRGVEPVPSDIPGPTV